MILPTWPKIEVCPASPTSLPVSAVNTLLHVPEFLPWVLLLGNLIQDSLLLTVGGQQYMLAEAEGTLGTSQHTH